MLTIDYAEFYITNVCNLNCPQCNRFNNYNFKGHQLWADFKEDYKKWAGLVNIKHIAIIGGEPMLNPDFTKWLVGLRALWPDARIKIVTNGTQLHKWPELYKLVLSDSNIYVVISLHGGESEIMVSKSVNKYFNHQPLIPTWQYRWDKLWASIRGDNWPDCDSPTKFDELPDNIKHECREQYDIDPIRWQKYARERGVTDVNGVSIQYLQDDEFYERAIKVDKIEKKITLLDSNPADAIRHCSFAINKCTQFIKGKFYKCSTVAVLPEFIKQFPVIVSNSDRALLNDYVPAEHTWDTAELEQFIHEINSGLVIPQCKFCPDNIVTTKFTSSGKKIPIFAV